MQRILIAFGFCLLAATAANAQVNLGPQLSAPPVLLPPEQGTAKAAEDGGVAVAGCVMKCRGYEGYCPSTDRCYSSWRGAQRDCNGNAKPICDH